MTPEEIERLIAERDFYKKTADTKHAEILIIAAGVVGLCKNLGVTDDNGNFPDASKGEKINLMRISKKISPVLMSKFNPFSDSEETFDNIIAPMAAVIPLWEKYKNEIKL